MWTLLLLLTSVWEGISQVKQKIIKTEGGRNKRQNRSLRTAKHKKVKFVTFLALRVYGYIWLSQVHCETPNNYQKCQLISGHRLQCSMFCFWLAIIITNTVLPSDSTGPFSACISVLIVWLSSAWVPLLIDQHLLLFSPLTSILTSSCGPALCVVFMPKYTRKGDLLDNLTLVKDAEDQISSLATHPQSYIYTHTHMNAHYCATARLLVMVVSIFLERRGKSFVYKFRKCHF